ncbi:MAG TPA: rhomboid family intramembrane serine protease [Terriglobales bacterium]|nr:rhomboid family intramembrane serine protease [Terriglobales bacterium]
MQDRPTAVTQCDRCGRELTRAAIQTGQLTCEECRQREFASHAEQAALRRPQYEFFITNLLLAANIGLYFWMVLFRHVSPTSPTTQQIIDWGGNYGPLTFGAEPWRLVTALFLHIGFAHLLANMWALYVLGRLAESLFGRWSFLSTYLIGGLCGSIASLLWNPLGVSAGASGAIFAIAGALITTFYVGKLPLPKHNIRYILVTLICFAGFDLLYGIWKQGVDNAAHIGGFVSGLVLGLLLGHHLGPNPRARLWRERVLIGGLAFLVLFAVFVWKRNGYISDLERARMLINNGAVEEGIRQLQGAASRRPDEPYILLLIGDAYAKKGDFAKAEPLYKRVTELKPKDPLGWNNLAQTYVAQEKWQDSVAAWVRTAELSKKDGAFAWFHAGQSYARMDKPGEAIKMYNKALGLAPNSVDIWANLGLAQMNLSQYDQAIVSFGRAVKLEPADVNLRMLLGNAYMQAGKEQEAQEQFFQASKLRAIIEQRLQQLQRRKAAKPMIPGQIAQPNRPLASPRAPAHKP